MGVAVLGESRVSSPIQVSEEEIYQIGMPMRSHNLILLFGLLVTITLTRASPLDAEEELDSDAIEDRYNDEDDDNYPDPVDKRAISGFEHALRIRPGIEFETCHEAPGLTFRSRSPDQESKQQLQPCPEDPFFTLWPCASHQKGRPIQSRAEDPFISLFACVTRPSIRNARI